MVHTIVVFCLMLNGYFCRSLEIIRADYSVAVTPIDCAMGGLIYATQLDQEMQDEGILFDGARWQIRGIRCEQDNGVVAGADLADRVKEHVK